MLTSSIGGPDGPNKIHATDSRFLPHCFNTFSLPLQVLWIQGPRRIFLDQQVATQAGFKLEQLEKPYSALAVDSRLLTMVTHNTDPLTLVFSGNHRESIQFHFSINSWMSLAS